MGRIKTQQIKRATFDFVKKHRDKFTDNFEENKKIINELLDIPSKQLRNTVAGYLTSAIHNKQKHMT